MQHLCKGATLMCTGGTSPSQLDVSPSRAIFIDNKPVANVADHIPMVNIKPFGNCTLMAPISPPPCMPATPSPWNSPNSTIKIDHQMALTFGCSLQCSIGGTIKCVDPGQVEVVGGNITPVSVAHSDSGGSSESNGNDDSQNDESKHSSHNQAQHLSHDSNVNSQGERVSRIPLGAGAGNEYDVSSIDFHRIRGLQASKIKLACTQCAVRTMKYLISGENKYLKLPLLPKTTAQTKEQVVISCNKGGFLSKRNKEIKEIKGGLLIFKVLRENLNIIQQEQ
ncbi:DUF4280 domain-containing protein [Vibrio parahaemolyticus]|nr:DUF4280 domain-containing protein [Vibrio parahaemolyticus]